MRYQPIDPATMTPRQREVADAIAARRQNGLDAPYAAMLYAPDVADRAQRLGEHLRFGLRVPERLCAVAILVTATRHRTEDAAYFTGLTKLQTSGLDKAKQDALAAGTCPADLGDDEKLVHDFASELAQTGRVRAATFTAAADMFGRDLVVELIGLCGYVAMMTVMLNVTQTRFTDA